MQKAMLDEGFLTQARGSAIQQDREVVYAALQYAASFHCLVEEWKDCEEQEPKSKEKCIIVDKKREVTEHKTEWCATASKYRCMRCGRGSKYMRMQGDSAGKCLMKDSERKLGRLGKLHVGGHDMVRRVDGHGEALIWCRQCSGYARRRMGQVDELL